MPLTLDVADPDAADSVQAPSGMLRYIRDQGARLPSWSCGLDSRRPLFFRPLLHKVSRLE